MALVFQYGSNCADSEINSRDRLQGDAKFADIAETVEDFELAFDVDRTNRGCAASDIVRKAGGKVWGVLYEIPDYLIRRTSAQAHGRKSLDAIEGEGTNFIILLTDRFKQAHTAAPHKLHQMICFTAI